ncbi:Pre-mRNA splicing Prp18-interacting factor-domain-containing protein [Acrodontium crateriforme]|uniref:Pre-mRNA-splicing factor SLU7 n=1 Tax=Acrodontium crateriforme TaxID=150365 RepID=A0AAQ3M4S2_9PEZI|nr:Pre-mRNA splicing Prp18-interacting factor-domain-containing protein [Acrodontium crateriforme]
MSRPGGSRNQNQKAVEPNKSNDRNEYIPSFIAKKPFYVDDATTEEDYLDHQRLQSQENKDSLANSKWYDRGKKAEVRATKFRKGACENCGSMSHKAKDCLQRKRKAGAKWTGKDIAADENVQDINLGWDAKRDRWNGFEAEEYKEVIEEYNTLEEMKKNIAGGDEEQEGNDDEGVKYGAETDMGRKQATSTRNLRLREDTAKYLLNLDLDSAKYDPKTRSMMNTETSTNELIAEDGFQRASGDAAEFERAQKYAWETQERGDKDRIHIQANPTEAQLTRKRKAEDELRKQEERKKMLAEKYGTQDAVQMKNPLAAEVTSNERYVEYDERGKIKGLAEKKEKSMYPEDVMTNNHTYVWGSWWSDFKWGYACCHSFVKNSFCTGDEGRKAVEEAERFSKGLALPTVAEANNAQVMSKDDCEMDETQRQEHMPNHPDKSDKQNMEEKRRRIKELKAGVTEVDMEEYRKQRTSKNDPMANLLGKDELLEH